MNNKLRLGLLGGGLLLSLGGVYYLSSVVVPRAMVTLTKAAPASKISFNNSYLLGQKLLVKADGEEKCLVNVYLLDERSQGVRGKAVTMEGSEEVEAVDSGMTDASGKASFQLASVSEGQVELTAIVEGVPLEKTVKCTFRNE